MRKSVSFSVIVIVVVFKSLLAAGPAYSPLGLGTLGGTTSEALGINNRGDVVGVSTTVGDVTSHAFLWSSGVMRVAFAFGNTSGAIRWQLRVMRIETCKFNVDYAR